MKIFKYISFLGVFAFMSVFTACEDILDLESEMSIDYDEVYVDADGIKLALDGAWSILAGPSLFAGTSVLQSDLIAADGTQHIIWDGTFIGYRQMFRKSLDPNEGTIAAKWAASYRAINIINNILANIDKVGSDKNRVEGEAKFIRGVLYFELVRFYAQPYGFVAGNTHPGVPLVLTPVLVFEDVTYPARATVAQIYAQIESDLTSAKALLDAGSAGANRGLATSTNTSAFLTRVYMSKKEWEKAATEATIVIDQFGVNALNSTPRAAFNNPGYTPEDVFMIRQNLYSNAGATNDGIGTFFASMPGFGRGDVRIQAAHRALYEAGDTRGGLTNNREARVINEIPEMYYVGYGTRSGRTRTSKWGQYYTNINVIRLAEMYLSRAEANFMNGSEIGATPMADLNKIRARASASLITDASEITLDVIKLDRYKELAFEGHAFADLKRWEGSVRAPAGSPWGAGTVIQWNDPRLVLPIPQREMEVNPNLVQNKDY
jgi:starch-binding outer membrane protein, SusD/RagB family